MINSDSMVVFSLFPVKLISQLKNTPTAKVIATEVTEIDARNLPCPMPLLKLKQALNNINDGEKVIVYATDPASSRDFKAFIALTGHQLSIKKLDDSFKFDVIKHTKL